MILISFSVIIKYALTHCNGRLTWRYYQSIELEIINSWDLTSCHFIKKVFDNTTKYHLFFYRSTSSHPKPYMAWNGSQSSSMVGLICSGSIKMIFDPFIKTFLNKMAWSEVLWAENFKLYRLIIFSSYTTVEATYRVFY